MPEPVWNDEQHDIYLMRRLRSTSRAPDLTSSMRFDLAASDLPDDELEEALHQFGASKGNGWGISEVLEDIMRREPEKIPVADLTRMQERLIEQGYMHDSANADGLWSPEWNGASRRMDRDLFEERLEGNHPLSTPVGNAFRFLGYIAPSSVFQGIVGAAKGIVAQAPETAENLGALGGLAAGAAIGSLVPGLGTGVGAAAGAVIGFFSDLFQGDEEEGEGRTFATHIWDALTPWEEYTGEDGFRTFAEDLGFVMTAASLVAGVGVGVKGVQAGLTGVGTEASKKGLLGALTQMPATGVVKPGYLTRTLSTAKGAGAVGAVGGAATGVAQGEDFGGVLMRAGIGAMGGAALGKFGGPVINKFGSRVGLNRVAETPLLKTVNGAYTGLSTAALGARMSGGLFSGERDTEIEEGIRSVKTPGGDWIDNTLGWVLFPNRFFPISGTEIAEKVGKGLGADRMLPYEFLALDPTNTGRTNLLGQAVERVGRREGMERVFRAMSPRRPMDKTEIWLSDQRLRLSMGIDLKVDQMMKNLDLNDVDYWTERTKAASALKRKFITEKQRFDANEISETPVFDELMTFAEGVPNDPDKGPTAFYAWLTDSMSGHGSGIDRMGKQLKSEEVSELGVKTVERGNAEFRFYDPSAPAPEPEEGVIWVAGEAPPQKMESFDARSIRLEARQKQQEATKIRSQVDVSEEDLQRAMNLEIEAKALNRKARKMPKDVNRHTVSLTPSNLADAATGLTDTPSAEDALRLAGEWDREVDNLKGALQRLRKAKTPEARAAHKEAYEKSVQVLTGRPLEKGQQGGLLHRISEMRLVPQKNIDKAFEVIEQSRFGGLKPQVKSIGGILSKKADILGHEVVLPPSLQAMLPEGKRILATGDDMIMHSDLYDNLAAANVDDFVMRPTVWDSLSKGDWAIAGGDAAKSVARSLRKIGFSTEMHSSAAIFRARAANQGAELQRILNEHGVRGVNGKQMMERLYDRQQTVNHGKGTIEQVVPGKPLLHRKINDPITGAPVRTEKRLYVADVRELSMDDIALALDVDRYAPVEANRDELLKDIYHALRRGAALGAETNWKQPLQTARALGRTLEIDGLPGFVEFMRTFHATNPRRFYGIGGAAVGAEIGQEEAGLTGVLTGAVAGGAIGMGLQKLLKMKWKQDQYGYLPDILHRASMALRYTFSVMFDAGRYMEQANIGLMKEDLPMFLSPWRYFEKNMDGLDGRSWKWHQQQARRLHDAMTGSKDMRYIEEIDRRMFQRGVLGYSPRDAEAARAYLIKRREPNVSLDELHRRVSELEGYGIGRRSWEKSANFIFFPFSFQKKLLTTMGDFVLQSPGRALLLHEGFRRFKDSSFDEKAGEFTERYLPIAQQLQRLNNLSYGVGPGRFFLQGLMDDPQGSKTDLGLAAQILSTTFVPSGSNTPLAQFFGGAGDAMVHLFVPTVVTETHGLEELLKAGDSFVPAFRDLTTLGRTAKDQFIAATDPGGDPFYQQQRYMDGKRLIKSEYEPAAEALGYASVEGLMQADPNLKAEYEAQLLDLQKEFTVGFDMAQKFENTVGMKEKALLAIMEKDDRSEAEEAIMRIAAMEAEGDQQAQILGTSKAEILSLIAPGIREEALAMVNDPEFAYLFDKLFARDYGPITMQGIA